MTVLLYPKYFTFTKPPEFMSGSLPVKYFHRLNNCLKNQILTITHYFTIFNEFKNLSHSIEFLSSDFPVTRSW